MPLSTTAKTPLVEQIVSLIEQIYLRLCSSPDRAWPGLELTMHQFRALALLRFFSEMRMTDLAARLGISLPSATSLIDRLAEKGLVERDREQEDRRVVICRLTSEGHAQLEQFWQLGQLRITSVMEPLGLSELQKIQEALEILLRAIDPNQRDSAHLHLNLSNPRKEEP